MFFLYDFANTYYLGLYSIPFNIYIITFADELIARVTVVDDQESLRSSRLEYSGKINERSRTIFGTGDLLRVVTITANTGFIR